MPDNMSANTSFPAIRVRIGYPWAKDDDGLVASRSDSRLQCIRGWVKSAGDTVKNSITKWRPGSTAFRLDVSRLRATHGQMLLHNLCDRIQSADILLFDIGACDGKRFNENVVLEAGMALAFSTVMAKRIFILKPKKLAHPSDLQGFLVSNYRLEEGVERLELEDGLGFHAALRSAIRDVAEIRGMVGPASKRSDDDEDDA